jgi:glycosyltransferase involved in cell wall biosynthesis
MKKEAQKHICFVANSTIWSENIGGAEVQSYLLASELATRGWVVTYATPKDNTLAKEVKEKQSLVRLSEFPVEKIRTPLDFARSVRHLVRIRANLYYQRGENILTFPTAVAAKLGKKSLIWASSMDVDCAPGKFWNRIKDKFVILNPKSIYTGIKAKAKDKLNAWSKKSASLILVQTEMNKRRLLESYGIEAEIFPTVHSSPENQVEKDSPPIILWLASLKAWKRPELFIELARDCQDVNAQFVIAGRPVSKHYPEALYKRMEGLKNIHYAGSLSFQESNSLIGRASLFVNTSEPQEGFPNTFIQSWMQGTYVLSLDVDPDRYLENEGLGARCDSIKGMGEKIKQLLTTNMLNDKSNKIRQFAHENFDISKKIQQFESFLLQ